MAGRNIKQGLVFFAFDCDLFKDRKVRLLERQHPRVGTLVYLHVLCEIYRDKGYFVPADDVLYDEIETSLKLELGEGIEIISSCVKYGLFDEHIYKSSGVLTSAGIQRRYNEAVRNSRRRGFITPQSEYSLIVVNGTQSDDNETTSSHSDNKADTQVISSEDCGRNGVDRVISSEEIICQRSISSEEIRVSSEEKAISSEKPSHNGTERNVKDNTHTLPEVVVDKKTSLLEGYISACASADRREAAHKIVQELQKLRFYQSAEWKSGALSLEYRFLYWLWLYYPSLQLTFEEPMITWQARQLLTRWHKDDVERIVERIANVKGLASEKRSFYLTVSDWLKRDFELKKQR